MRREICSGCGMNFDRCICSFLNDDDEELDFDDEN
jgi:hypothetical protein